jgi:TRAP transporter solute receptor, TAXI family
MHKKPLLTAIASGLALTLGVTLSGLAQAQDKDFKWPRMLRVATPGTASGSFASTNGWAPLLQKDTGMSVRVMPEDSETVRYSRLTQQKQFDLASISSAEARYQIEGVDGYAGVQPAPLRIVWHHNDTPWVFLTRGDSKIKTIYDLKRKGIKISLSSQSPPMMRAVQEALPAFLGLTPEQAAEMWTFVPAGSYVENCRSVTDGRTDVAWCASVSAVVTEMEGSPGGIRVLDMPLSDKEAWNGWLSVRPEHIPAKVGIGAKSTLGTEGLVSNFLYWTRPDVDADLVYNLAKWLHQSYDAYKGTHTLAARMSVDLFREYLDRSPMPVHEGTIRYLREIGKWTDEDDKWNQEAIERMDAWMKAREKALAEAKAKGVKIHWENPEFMAIMKAHTKDLPVFRTRL